jgi:hypothetical protein
VRALDEQVKDVKDGDLSHQESMLTTQAKTLDLIFHKLARRSFVNLAEYPQAADTYMRLALKAQSQCRTTIEALAEIKNPRPVAFVRQANIANGPQQVNNGQPEPRARETESTPNKVLGDNRGEWLDTGTQGAAGGADTELATLGTIHRAENGGG